MTPRNESAVGGVLFIAIFDLIKAGIFLVAAVGMFHLVDRNAQVELTRLLHVFRINGDHAFVSGLLLKANVITNPDKRIFTGVLLLYTGLYVIEGIGLLLRRRWAEYFAIIMTAIPLPFEAYELARRAAPLSVDVLVPQSGRLHVFASHEIFMLKVAVLIINAGIVWYLVVHLRHSSSPERRSDAL